jgi:hypothetical protein
MVSLLTRPDRLWNLRQVVTDPDHRFQGRQDWQALQDWFQGASGLHYDTDLRPWLGDEITFSVTAADLDKDPDNGQQPGYLLVLTSRQGLSAREALHLFWQQRGIAGDNLVFEPLSGLTLIYNRPPTMSPSATVPFRPLASTVVGDRYILIANDPQVLRQAIATFRAPDISLAKTARYRQLIADLPPGRIGWMYSNLPATLTWLGLDQESKGAMSPPALQNLFLSWRLTPEGLVADTAITPAPGRQFLSPVQPPALPPDTLQWLPAGTDLALAGTDLPQLWQGLLHNLGGYGVAAAAADQLRPLTLTASGTAIDRLPELWTNGPGPYALGWLPQQQDWIFVTAAAPHRPSQAKVADRLDQLAQQQGWGVGQLMLADQPVTAWTALTVAPSDGEGDLRLQTQLVAVHAQQANYDIFATSLQALQQALETHAGPVPAAATPLSAAGTHVLYLQWPQLQPYLAQKWPQLRPLLQAAQPITTYLGTLVLTSGASTPAMEKGALTIAFNQP